MASYQALLPALLEVKAAVFMKLITLQHMRANSVVAEHTSAAYMHRMHARFVLHAVESKNIRKQDACAATLMLKETLCWQSTPAAHGLTLLMH
jgi:hypothetical protein